MAPSISRGGPIGRNPPDQAAATAPASQGLFDDLFADLVRNVRTKARDSFAYYTPEHNYSGGSGYAYGEGATRVRMPSTARAPQPAPLWRIPGINVQSTPREAAVARTAAACLRRPATQAAAPGSSTPPLGDENAAPAGLAREPQTARGGAGRQQPAAVVRMPLTARGPAGYSTFRRQQDPIWRY